MRMPIRFLLLAAGIALAAPAFAQQAAPAGDPKEAHKKIAMCEGCHGIPGYKTAYPLVYHVPKLGGQSAEYVTNAPISDDKSRIYFKTMHETCVENVKALYTAP